MNKTVLVIIGLILAFGSLQSYDNRKWQTINRGEPAIDGIMRIDALDSNHFAISRTYQYTFPPYTYIEVTNDYGATWDTVYYKSKINKQTETIYDIKFINQNTIVAIYGNGRLLKTTDRGETWTIIPITEGDETCYGYQIKNYGDTLIVSNQSRNFAISYDCGDSWNIKYVDQELYTDDKYERKMQGSVLLLKNKDLISSIQYDSKFECRKYANIANVNTVYIKSSDMGLNWKKIILAEENGNCNFLETEDKIYTYTFNSSFLDSVYVTDNGNKIKVARGILSYNLFSLEEDRMDTVAHIPAFYNILNCGGVFFGQGLSNVYYSTDTGYSWNSVNSSLNDTLSKLEDFTMTDLNHGMMVLARRILRLENATSVESNDLKSDPISIYPNPISNNKLNLTFDLTASEQITFKIYDLSGRIIKKGDLGYLEYGKHSIVINLEDIQSNGKYFITVDANKTTLGTKHFIIQ